MTIGDWVQTVIGVLSLIATIVLSIVIYRLERKHQETMETAERKREQKELIERAHLFISENNEEIGYLPLCVLAAKLHRHDNHTRKIYTNFCRCSAELQEEILKQSDLENTIPVGSEWVDDCLDSLRQDINKHRLGTDHLYDGAKYFHRAYERYKAEKWKELTTVCDFDTIVIGSGFFAQKKQSLIDYINEYFLFLYSEHKPALYNHNPYPPFDYFWGVYGLGEADEIEVCRWIMEAVHSTLIIIHNREFGVKEENHIMGDSQPQTFEDKYYETLMWLYFTYNTERNC